MKTVATKAGHQWIGATPSAGRQHHWWPSWRDFCTAAKSVDTAAVSPPANPNSPPMHMLLQQPSAVHHHAPHEEQPLDFSVGTMSKYKQLPVKSQGQAMLQQNGGHHIVRHHRNNNKHSQDQNRRSYQQQQDTSSSSSEDEGVGPPSPSAAESPGPLRGDGELMCLHGHHSGDLPAYATRVISNVNETLCSHFSSLNGLLLYNGSVFLSPRIIHSLQMFSVFLRLSNFEYRLHLTLLTYHCIYRVHSCTFRDKC